jgi:flavin-dependent dehydrogenase
VLGTVFSDIIVVGGGPAGATIARLLALHGQHVTLVDEDNGRPDRLEILSPFSLQVLDALGLTGLLSDAVVARPCAGIRRRNSPSSRPEFDDFFYRLGGRGYVVDRAQLDARLRGLAKQAGAVLDIGRVNSIERMEGGFSIRVVRKTHTATIQALRIVDASGRPSFVARRLGARKVVTEKLTAERYMLDKSLEPSQAPVWLDFEPCHGGWIYCTYGPDGRQERWKVRQDNVRCDQAMGPCVNASSSWLSKAAGGDWIAVGDAAIAFDPIASQGLANAFSTALVATGAIVSPEGLGEESAAAYTEAVTATYLNSERGRAIVYSAIDAARV